MFRKKNYLALGAVTLLALLILSLRPRVTSRLKLAAAVCSCRCSGWPTPPCNFPPICRPVMPRPNCSGKLTSCRGKRRTSRSSLANRRQRARKQPAPLTDRLAAASAMETQARQRHHARPGQLVGAPCRLTSAAATGFGKICPCFTADGLVGRVFLRWLHAFAGRFDWRSGLPRLGAH